MTTVPVPVASLVSAIRNQRNRTHPLASPGQEAVTAGVSPGPVSRSAELLETSVEALAAYAGHAMAAPIVELVSDVVYELNVTAARAVQAEARARTLGEDASLWQALAEVAEDVLPVLGVEVVELLHRAVEAEHLAAELTLVVERLAGDQLGDSQVRDRLRRARIRAGEEGVGRDGRALRWLGGAVMADAAVQAKARRLPAALLAALRMMSERSAVGLCTIATTGPIGDGEISLTTARALVRRRMAAAEGSAYSATPAGEAYLRDLTWRRNGQ